MKVVVVGNDDLSNQIASLYKHKGSEVLLFGGNPSKHDVNIDKSRHFSLDIPSLRRESGLIQNFELVVVLSCNKDILEEVLFIVSPFCSIIIIGPIERVFEDLDLYSTVHYKNLSVSFLPQVKGTRSNRCAALQAC